MDIVKLSKMNDKQLTSEIKNMSEEEVEALLTLMDKLKERRYEMEQYLLNM